MKTNKKYFPATIFSGEIVLRGDSYTTYEEAKSKTDHFYDKVEWEEYNEKGRFVRSSYDNACPWM